MQSSLDEEQRNRLSALRRIRRRLRLLPLSALESLADELDEVVEEGEVEPLAVVLAVRGAARTRGT